MLDNETAQIVINLNQVYMAGAAELCRKDAQQAGILLHLPKKDVEALAGCTVSDLNRLASVPFALVHPHRSMRKIFSANATSDLLAPLISALESAEEEGNDQ